MYAWAAAEGEMLLPPEEREPSGSLKVRRWLGCGFKDLIVEMSEARFDTP